MIQAKIKLVIILIVLAKLHVRWTLDGIVGQRRSGLLLAMERQNSRIQVHNRRFFCLHYCRFNHIFDFKSPKPKKFIEKSRNGAQMLCISFSSGNEYVLSSPQILVKLNWCVELFKGGYYLSAGSNDHVIRVYYFENNQPVKICELEFHKVLICQIQLEYHGFHRTFFLCRILLTAFNIRIIRQISWVAVRMARHLFGNTSRKLGRPCRSMFQNHYKSD